MKKALLLLQLFLLAALFSPAQNVAINNDGSQPHASAMLDIKSNTKGLLVPRMTAAERTAIATPATGLLVYQTDGTAGFYYYSGSAWQQISAPANGPSGAWQLNGNTGTVPGQDFIGTTDYTNLMFATNYYARMMIHKNGLIKMGSSVSSVPDALLHLRNDSIGKSAFRVEDNNNANTVPGVFMTNQSKMPVVHIEKTTAQGHGLEIKRRYTTGNDAALYLDDSTSGGHNIHAIEQGEGINGYFFNSNLTGNQPNILSQTFGDHAAGEFYKGISATSTRPSVLVSTAAKGEGLYVINSNPQNYHSILKVENQAANFVTNQVAVEGISKYSHNGIGGRFWGGSEGIEADGNTGAYITAVEEGLHCEVINPATNDSYTTGVYAEVTSNSPHNIIGIWSKVTGPANAPFKTSFYGEGNVNITGSYFTSSDRMLKQNIQPLSGSLQKLMQLKPSSYQYKTAEYKIGLPEGRQMGLIAQDLQTVFPELVQQQIKPEEKNKRGEVTDPELKYLGVNYTGLIPVAIGAIQELKKENDELKAELAAIKQKLGIQ